MNGILLSLSFAIGLPMTGRLQADLTHFDDGISVPYGQAVDYADLKSSGKDHIRFVYRFNIRYPGNDRPPIITANTEPLVREIKQAQAAGLGVILATEATAQENQALFFQNIEISPLTGRVYPKSRSDFGRFDTAYRQLADALDAVNSRLFMWEIFPEPGWAFRDMGAGDIVDRLMAGRSRQDRSEAEKGVKESLPNHPAQRKFATEILERFEDHVIPLIRKKLPNVTLLLGTPGFGAPNGPGVYQDIDPNRYPNTVLALHVYGPRQVSHNGDRGAKLKDLSWPMPNWKSAFADAGSDAINTIDYEFDRRPWNYAGLLDLMQDVARWRDRFPGAKVHVSEFGGTESARETEAGQAYIADMRKAIRAVGMGATEWRG